MTWIVVSPSRLVPTALQPGVERSVTVAFAVAVAGYRTGWIVSAVVVGTRS